MLYRALRQERKKRLKLTHAAVMISALLLASVGLRAVFDFHNNSEPPINNMYSLHSWLGMATMVMFALQVKSYYIRLLVRSLYLTALNT